MNKRVIYILFFLITSITLLPFLWMLYSSFHTNMDLINGNKDGILNFTFSNFVHVFRETNLPIYIVNSLIVSTVTVVLTGMFSFSGAYVISRFSFKGKNIISFFSLLGYMIAPIILVIPMFIIMKNLGIANTRLSLILAHTTFCFPFSFWMFISYFKSLPIEFEKASIIDGANSWETFYFVVLPNMKASIVAVSIFTFILSWNDYVFARVLITGDNLKTIPVGIEDMYNATIVDWGVLMASGITISIPIVIAFIILYRFLNLKSINSGLKF